MSNEDYTNFLATKVPAVKAVGIEVDGDTLNVNLKDFQRACARWAIRRGRAALFEGCGLGKTLQQLVWAEVYANHTGKPTILLAPLAVAEQTVSEAAKFGVGGDVSLHTEDFFANVVVTNYEKLHLIHPELYGAVVLDESSILKSFMGKTKQALFVAFAQTPYRLCCTATPAPNDYLEIGNHAEFLGIMDSNEMISRWFVNDSMKAGGYRLKGHAAADFWRWVASWAICISKPSDIGFSDEGYDLPELRMHYHVVDVDATTGAADGELFRDGKLTATSLHKEMRLTCNNRAGKISEIVAAEPEESWFLWSNTNYEADELRRVVPGLVDVRGSDTAEKKTTSIMSFVNGKIKRMSSKSKIAGFGLNLQVCHKVGVIGLSYSWEQLYQLIRRFWRFGQTNVVDVHIVHATTEGTVLKSIATKEAANLEMQSQMIAAMKQSTLESLGGGLELSMNVRRESVSGKNWTMVLNDSCEEVKKVPDKSIDFHIFSPPFALLYIYSDSLRDMGNSDNYAEFFKHFDFLIPELYRVTVPGRLCAVHCKDLPLYMGRDSEAGLSDFPGDIVRAFIRGGWTYHSRVTIWKDPVIEMQRTKNHGLLHKTLCNDSSAVRQGMADYLLVFRRFPDGGLLSDKPVTRPPSVDESFDRYVGSKEPVNPSVYCRGGEPERGAMVPSLDGKGQVQQGYGVQVWQRYASPVWFDIDQTDVLNYRTAKSSGDEKHICPLQLGVIERAIHLWTNPGDTVFSPFGGIGSEGHVALGMGRKFLGVELKDSYFRTACKNLERAEREAEQASNTLFSQIVNEPSQSNTASPESEECDFI